RLQTAPGGRAIAPATAPAAPASARGMPAAAHAAPPEGYTMAWKTGATTLEATDWSLARSRGTLVRGEPALTVRAQARAQPPSQPVVAFARSPWSPDGEDCPRTRAHCSVGARVHAPSLAGEPARERREPPDAAP